MDTKRNEGREGVEPTIQIPVRSIEQYLKKNYDGPGVEESLRFRTVVHWTNPELDRLSNRMIPVYERIAEQIKLPTKFLDAGCMCGWLKHFILRRRKTAFRYIGIDTWPAALKIAQEFDPLIEVYNIDLLNGDLLLPLERDYEKKYVYSTVNNIQFGDDAPKVIQRIMDVTEEAAFFGMPDYCGNYTTMAEDLGFKTETFDCGEAEGSHQYLVKVWR